MSAATSGDDRLVAAAPTQVDGLGISLWGVLFQSITGMALAVGIALAILTAFAGDAAPLALLFALAVSLLVASSFAQMSRRITSAGSFGTYLSEALHPSVGLYGGFSVTG